MSFLDAMYAWLRKKKPHRAFNPNTPLSHVFVDVDAHVDPAELARMAPGLQAQLREDFAPEWGVGAKDVVRTQTNGGPPRAGEVEIQLHANAPADEEGALAIHDKKPDGTPIIHAYVALAKMSEVSLSSCVSHELLEARADPELDRVATLPDGRVVAVEIADAVERDGYTKLGVEVSNFSTMANFGIGHGKKFDFLGQVKTMFEVLPGGYAQVRDPRRGWVQLGPSNSMSAYRAEIARLGLGRGARRAAKGLPWWRSLLAWLTA